MKPVFIICLTIFLSTGFLQAKEIVPQVKEEIELMSALARLAGYEEFRPDTGGSYKNDIDSYLKKYRLHKAVEMMKNFRNTHKIEADDVMTMALQFECLGDHIVKLDTENNHSIPLNDKETSAFLDALNDFYRQSDFRKFFDQHSDVYANGILSFYNSVVSHIDPSWYSRFYGTQPNKDLHIVIGFASGGNYYRATRTRQGGPEEIFSIMYYAVDNNGRPLYDKSAVGTITEELCLSFIDIENNDVKTTLEKACENVHRYTREKPIAAVTDKSIMEESLAYASAIYYLIDNGSSKKSIRKAVDEGIERGFSWTPELIKRIYYYTENRKEFPTFASFYPEIIEFFKDYTANLGKTILKVLR